MGSGKGTQTQQQSYVASPQIQAAGTQALNQAQSAAQLPFNLPTAPVAGFNPQQQQAFQQYGQLQGMAQPYFNQAQGLFNQSAAPISGSQINQYLNPYAGNVLAQLQSQQGAQMADLTGKATQTAGGVGADRIGVAQGQLANQQSLATGQTLAGIYGSALGAAQQDAQRQQAAAYGIGNLGGAAQNAALQGTNALYGSGAYQQQLNQAQLNAPYQNQVAQAAFPYQQAQYLAGVTGNLAGAFGGTTYGQMTPAQPSMFSQVAGLGTGLAGAYGAYNNLGGGGGIGNYGQAANATGLGAGTGGLSFPMFSKDGGRIGYDSGGGVGGGVTGEAAWMNADPAIPTMQMHPAQVNQPKLNWNSGSQDNIGSDIGNIAKAAAQVAPLFLNRGGSVYSNKFADGGDSFDSRFDPAYSFYPGPTDDQRAAGADMLRSGMGTRAPDSIPGGEPAPSINPDQPYRLAGPIAMQAWRDNPSTKLTVNPTAAAAPTLNALHEDEDTAAPPPASPYGGSRSAAMSAGANADMNNRTYAVPYPDVGYGAQDTSRDFAKSPWLALMNAGFGMMAGTSPYAGVNIGKGLLAGTQTLEKQREQSREDENVNQRARQLAMQAQQHLDSYTRTTPTEAANIENQQAQRAIQRAQLEQQGWQIAYDQTTGKSYWTKHGETPVLATPGTGGPDGSALPPNANPTAGVVPPAGNVPTRAPTDFSYTPPSSDQSTGPGPVFNPKTGALSPEQAQITRKDMDDARIKSNAAAASELRLGQMRQAFAQIDAAEKQSGGLLGTGAYAEQRFNLAKTLNAALTPLGIKPIDPAAIGSAEELNKLNTNLGFELARTLGSREAQMIVQQAINANPSINNTPEGRRRIMASMDAAIARDKENAQFVGDYRKQWRTTAGAEAEFNRLNPPEKYNAMTGVKTAPEEFQKPDAFKKAVERLRANPGDAKTVNAFNQIYGGTAAYFLKGAQ